MLLDCAHAADDLTRVRSAGALATVALAAGALATVALAAGALATVACVVLASNTLHVDRNSSPCAGYH